MPHTTFDSKISSAGAGHSGAIGVGKSSSHPLPMRGPVSEQFFGILFGENRR